MLYLLVETICVLFHESLTVSVQITHPVVQSYSFSQHAQSSSFAHFQCTEPNHQLAIQKVAHPQGNTSYLPQPSNKIPAATSNASLSKAWFSCIMKFFGPVAVNDATVVREISVSQHLWLTEPDKTSAFPAVAAPGLRLEKGQLYQHGLAELHHQCGGANFVGCRMNSRWHGGMQPRRKIWTLAAMKKSISMMLQWTS